MGASTSAAAVAGLLETSRILAHLYADPATRPAVNVHFVLVGGSATFDYVGAAAWAREQHVSNLVAVLFVDGLGAAVPVLRYLERPQPEPKAATEGTEQSATAPSAEPTTSPVATATKSPDVLVEVCVRNLRVPPPRAADQGS